MKSLPPRFFSMLLAGMATFGSLLQAQTTFQFTLDRAARTSAGVYDSSGKMIRTLWADAHFAEGGTLAALWDNLDDWGNAAPAGTYSIKVLAHNANYVWEGVLANTSDYFSGTTVHSNFNFATTLSFSGSMGNYAVGYSENQPAFYNFATSAPNQVVKSYTGCATGGNDMGFRYSDSDSTRVYYACPVTQDQTTELWTQPGAVCAFDPLTGAVSNFTSGYAIWEKWHPFTNGVRVGTQPRITGLAVQKNGGTYLAVSVAADNKVYLLDKASGSVVKSFPVTAPKALAFDNSDDLWVVSGSSVANYKTLTGTPTLSSTINGFQAPLALAVSPAASSQPNLLLVADGGNSQQVKAFTLSGTSQWTLGQAGGYASSPNVTNDKFWFLEAEAFGTSEPNAQTTSLAFQPDGSFWVIDPMNCRILRFGLGASAGLPPVYQTQIAYRGVAYVTAVDRNNPTRVFSCSRGKWLEYRVDYSKTLAPGNGSWTLVKNWSYNLPAGTVGYAFQGFMSVATLSNGRTYGLARDTTLVTPLRTAVFELPATGHLRRTAANAPVYFLEADGSLRPQAVSGNTIVFSKMNLLGFDTANDPVWAPATTLASAPAVTGTNPRSGSNGNGPNIPITSGNKLVFFDHSKNDGMHLGGIDLSGSTTAWSWESARAVPNQVPLIGNGSYDNSPNIHYGGGLCDAAGRNIVFTYKGEFWSNSQANQLMHYYDNGLFVGQFGTPGNGPGKIPQGAAGNLATPYATISGGKTYVYTNDESIHGGVHRWRLDGTNTIGELSGSGMLNSTITLSGTAPISTAPSTSGVPARPTQLNGTASNGHVHLEWNPVAGATYYQVRRSTAAKHGYQIIATGVFQSSFNDLTASNGTTYYYKVNGINEKGMGQLAIQTVGTPSVGTSVYEAEDGIIAGPAARNDLWASGKLQVANTGTGSITINGINGGAGGTFGLVMRYSHNLATNWAGATLKVNGVNVTLPVLPPTGGWQGGLVSPYKDITVNVSLNSGTNNSLVLSKGPCVDKFTVLVDTPFRGVPMAVPSPSGILKVEAEDYDYGGLGVAFHDTGTANTNSCYRPYDGVAISQVPAASNNFNIGYIGANEWLNYTISVPTTNTYTLKLYAGTNASGKTLRVMDENGTNLTGTMTIGNTGSYTTYAANTATVVLTAGTHILRIHNITGGYNLDYFTLEH
jgi:hypothetical protein